MKGSITVVDSPADYQAWLKERLELRKFCVQRSVWQPELSPNASPRCFTGRRTALELQAASERLLLRKRSGCAELSGIPVSFRLGFSNAG